MNDNPNKSNIEPSTNKIAIILRAVSFSIVLISIVLDFIFKTPILYFGISCIILLYTYAFTEMIDLLQSIKDTLKK